MNCFASLCTFRTVCTLEWHKGWCKQNGAPEKTEVVQVDSGCSAKRWIEEKSYSQCYTRGIATLVSKVKHFRLRGKTQCVGGGAVK